ncbi:MAG: single-stranded DNA-binding protein [Crocinitomicaceae bacterium]|nr:single-stranded DNA-binding protein [Crocinitomicaceae bacterium]
MNHVNLIGKITSEPKVVLLQNGQKIAQFSMSTQESYLDQEGNLKNRKQWHQISAWGNWVHVLEQLGTIGLSLAIEGKLVSRFYKTKTGDRKVVTEVEVNDLVVL